MVLLEFAKEELGALSGLQGEDAEVFVERVAETVNRLLSHFFAEMPPFVDREQAESSESSREQRSF